MNFLTLRKRIIIILAFWTQKMWKASVYDSHILWSDLKNFFYSVSLLSLAAKAAAAATPYGANNVG